MAVMAGNMVAGIHIAGAVEESLHSEPQAAGKNRGEDGEERGRERKEGDIHSGGKGGRKKGRGEREDGQKERGRGRGRGWDRRGWERLTHSKKATPPNPSKQF